MSCCRPVVALVVTASALCASACGGAHRGPAPAAVTPPTPPPGAARTVNFIGGRVSGTLYLIAEPPEGKTLETTDVYRIRGRLNQAQRLTYSKDAGVDDIDVRDGVAILSDARATGVDYLRRLDLNAPPSARAGRALALAQLPVLGPHGQVAFSRLVRGRRRNGVFLMRLSGGRPRLVSRSRLDLDAAGFDPQGRLAVYRDPGVVLFDVGGRHQHTVVLPSGVRGKRILGSASVGGIALGGVTGRVAVLSWDGRVRGVVPAEDPVALSPDARTLLASDRRGRRLSLVDVATGRTTALGTSDGYVIGGVWTSP